MEFSHLTPKDKAYLQKQTLLGWAAFALVGPGSLAYAKWVRGHRVEGLEQARKLYREALATGRPTIICANHLTMVDSVFLHHGFASLKDYLLDFRRFSWNVPAAENFQTNIFLKTIVYLGKTIPIRRGGDEEHRKAVLEKIKYLVSTGDVCTIFPEGQRSRTGRVDPRNLTYGIGQILKDLDRPQVICAYVRGEHQETWSTMPTRGDTIHLRAELLEPTTKETGLRAARDLSRQVLAKIEAMEADYFAEKNGVHAP